MPRALVLTLHSGEQEYERAVASLRRQTFTRFEHRVFENLPNKEAHEALQHAVMESGADFDVFLKLDADMVLRSDDALERIVALFREHPGVDHVRSVVHDWFSDSLIMGLHAWSNRVRWESSDERLFVDTHPVFPGEKLSLWSDPAPFAEHCPDPSPHQAFHFGRHRALKALQSDRGPATFSYGLAIGQWRILRGTWEHFRRSGDPRLGLAMMGADAVLCQRVGEAHVTDKRDDARALFEACADLSADELSVRLAPRWGRWLGAPLRYALRIAPRALVAAPREVAQSLFGASS